MKAMVLAAGYGSRFRPHTDKLPKPAIPFLTVPLIGYSAYYLRRLGVTDLVINTHHLSDIVEKVCQETLGPLMNLHFSNEQPRVLESGGGIQHARSLLTGQQSFVTANADALMFAGHDTLRTLWEHHDKTQALATLLVCPHPKIGHGLSAIWLEPYSDEVVEIGRSPSSPRLKGWHYTGYMVLSERIFNYLPAGASNIFLHGLLPAISQGEKVCAVQDTGIAWFETGDLESYLEASQKIAQAIFTPASQQDEEIKTSALDILGQFHPDMVMCHPNVLADPSAEIDADTRQAHVIAGKGTKVDSASQLIGNVVLGEHTLVTASEISDSVTGEYQSVISRKLTRELVI